ncbi:site-specific DNA-methyltransferase [Azospirillum sp. Sh1]|uniref:site-specific DNA-methyltransferase n=1 Tax=Azospirillum sp. Sh1 TaxID=2607285 RepID=UPI0011EC4CE2|nr:site-specific DNA-methyltransferase [Azospirillum sp. Sh1]KAA0576695.1 hypothetical protein FZ029_12575 [Azospirillum sp. Sh1]
MKGLEITYLPLDGLKPYDRNPKTHSPEQIERLVSSLTEFGWTRPLLVADDGQIVAGHGTWTAAKLIRDRGLSIPNHPDPAVAPTVALAHLTPDQRRAYVIADNRLSELGRWDDDLLGSELADLQGLGVDLDTIGFDAADLEALCADGTGAGTGTRDGATGRTLVERFGVPPFTVLDARQGYWRDRKAAWTALGVHAQEGRENLPDTNVATDWMRRGSAVGGSAFDPVLAELIFRWFTPGVGSAVLDPFGGEATKGVIAATLGYEYTGVELRPEQVKANREQWERVRARLSPERLAQVRRDPVWIEGDSAQIDNLLPAGRLYDLVFTSPPYYDLEIYSKGDKDGSALETYDRFIGWYRKIFRQACGRLKPNRFAVVKIGDVRDERGFYRNFLGNNIACFLDAGLGFYNEAVLATPIGSLALRAGRQFTASRKLGRGHQNVLVFFGGDPGRIKAEFPQEIEVGDVVADDSQP